MCFVNDEVFEFFGQCYKGDGRDDKIYFFSVGFCQVFVDVFSGIFYYNQLVIFYFLYLCIEFGVDFKGNQFCIGVYIVEDVFGDDFIVGI